MFVSSQPEKMLFLRIPLPHQKTMCSAHQVLETPLRCGKETAGEDSNAFTWAGMCLFGATWAMLLGTPMLLPQTQSPIATADMQAR